MKIENTLNLLTIVKGWVLMRQHMWQTAQSCWPEANPPGLKNMSTLQASC